MLRKLRALLALPLGERLILGHAWMALLVIDVGLRCLSLQRLESWLCRGRGRGRRGREEQEVVVVRLHALVAIAGRHQLISADCLHRSLALLYLLHRRGISAQLRLGVRREERKLEAHAWVEWKGQPVGESTRSFVALEGHAAAG